MLTNCPVCKTELRIAPGIGPFCPKRGCPVADGPSLYNEDGTLKDDVGAALVYDEDEGELETINLTVKRVVVVVDSGTDSVMFACVGPSPTYPFDRNEFTMKIEAAHGTGAKYVRENFGIEPEVVDVKAHRKKST